MPTPDPRRDEVACLRVALCQVATEPWALDDNLARTLAALEAAAGAGAELAITPECVLHGYADGLADQVRDRLTAAAESTGGRRLAAIRRAAARLDLDVVVGFAERGRGGKLHNSAAFCRRTGEIAAVYRKVHCRDFESAEHLGLFTPGGRFPVVEVSRGERSFRVGLMICFDREVVESVRCLRAAGAELIACPLATNTSRLDAPGETVDNEQLTRCRAAENEVFIAVVNHAVRFNGGSFVVGPGGQVIVQLGEAAEVRVVDLPLGAVARDFHARPLGWMGWGYRRPGVYRRYLG